MPSIEPWPAARETIRSSKRVLEPHERIAEVLFGLIMVLTFTGSLHVSEPGPDTVRTMLHAALGCNLAWGLIDAVFYLMGSLAEKGRGLVAWRAAHRAAEGDEGRRRVAEALPAELLSAVEATELDVIHRRLKAQPSPPERAHLDWDDYRGAVGVFLLVFLSTFPVVIPFLLMDNATAALRVSHAIAIALLFFAGDALGRYAGLRPWKMGITMVVVGLLLAGLSLWLGG